MTLQSNNSQYFNLTYGYPQDGEISRIQFQVKMSTILTSSTRSTLICVNTNSSSFTVSSGSTLPAFGMMFYCGQSTCANSSDVSVQLYGSTVVVTSGIYQWFENTKYDIEAVNKGSTDGDGTTVKSIYGLDTAYLRWANVPDGSSDTFLK